MVIQSAKDSKTLHLIICLVLFSSYLCHDDRWGPCKEKKELHLKLWRKVKRSLMMSCLHENIIYIIFHFLSLEILWLASSSVKVILWYRMMLTRIFKHFKVPLDGQTSLKSTHSYELTFDRMGKDAIWSTCYWSQRGARDEVHEELDRDEPALDQPGEETTLRETWNRTDSTDASKMPWGHP